MVRLAVGVWPPSEVMATLACLDRPTTTGVRWSVPEQWIVTVRPLGHVAERLVPELVEALGSALAGWPAVACTVGPATRRLGGQWLGAPVAGLDDLAGVIFEVTSDRAGHPSAALPSGHRPRPRAGAKRDLWPPGLRVVDRRRRVARRRPLLSARDALRRSGALPTGRGASPRGLLPRLDIEAAIGDRKGGFVVSSSGTFDGEKAAGPWSILDGSGRGQLKGITGSGQFDSPHGGTATYALTYEVG